VKHADGKSTDEKRRWRVKGQRTREKTKKRLPGRKGKSRSLPAGERDSTNHRETRILYFWPERDKGGPLARKEP